MEQAHANGGQIVRSGGAQSFADVAGQHVGPTNCLDGAFERLSDGLFDKAFLQSDA